MSQQMFSSSVRAGQMAAYGEEDESLQTHQSVKRLFRFWSPDTETHSPFNPRETNYQIRLIFNAEHTVWFIMNQTTVFQREVKRVRMYKYKIMLLQTLLKSMF